MHFYKLWFVWLSQHTRHLTWTEFTVENKVSSSQKSLLKKAQRNLFKELQTKTLPISYKDPDKTPDILKETERKLAWMKPRWLMTSPIQNRTKHCTLNCFTIAQAEKQMSLHFKPNLKFSLLFFRDSLILHGNFKTKTEPSNQVFLRSSWASFKKKHSCVRLKVRLTWFTRWLDFCSIIADVFFRSQMATGLEATVKLIFSPVTDW